jgi:hypothetical protein
MYKGRHYFNVVGKYAMYNNDMDLAKSRSVERKFAKKIFAKKNQSFWQQNITFSCMISK